MFQWLKKQRPVTMETPQEGDWVEVNGLVLPPRLVFLLATGAWKTPVDPGWWTSRRPGTNAGDVEFLSFRGIRFETESIVGLAKAGDLPQFGMFISKFLGKPVELPLLDVEKAVMIAAQIGDSAMVLDYRRSAFHPQVLETDWTASCQWRVIAPSFDAFADMLGLPGSKN